MISNLSMKILEQERGDWRFKKRHHLVIITKLNFTRVGDKDTVYVLAPSKTVDYTGVEQIEMNWCSSSPSFPLGIFFTRHCSRVEMGVLM